jgi:hypothetical protein
VSLTSIWVKSSNVREHRQHRHTAQRLRSRQDGIDEPLFADFIGAAASEGDFYCELVRA